MKHTMKVMAISVGVLFVMMDEDFDKLMISSPEIVRLFDEHLAMHQQELAKAQAAQMQQLMAAKGAPDGPPTPAGGSTPAPANGGAPAEGMPEADMQSMMNVPDVMGGGAVQTRAMRSTGG